jgi:ribonuclease HI
MAKPKYYAVAVGRRPGIYTQWFGEGGAQVQVNGFAGARFKSFPTREQARRFMASGGAQKTVHHDTDTPSKQRSSSTAASPAPPVGDEHRVVIYTDGSSLGNPGPGGYGVVLALPEGDREYSGGYRRTTNNRMELLACIVGLEALASPAAVALYSDSRYVVDGITKGWAKRWQRGGWRKSSGEPALNVDLWERLLAQCERHDVTFNWVKGHAGNPANERCDQLATQSAARPGLPVDPGYKN